MLVDHDVETITSRRNALVGLFRELARGRSPDDRRMLIEGLRLLREAVAARVPIQIVALAAEVVDHDRDAGRLGAELAASGTRLVRVTSQVLEAMSPARKTTGVVAIGERPSSRLDDLLSPTPPLVIALDGVQDPGNVGAVIRTAEAAGATGVIAGARTADPFGWKALRGAMGSAFRIPVLRAVDTSDVMGKLTPRGLRLVAAATRGGRPMFDVDFRGPTLILLGSEGGGISPELTALADEHVSIPMRQPVESLNISVTAALILYEAARQRRAI